MTYITFDALLDDLISIINIQKVGELIVEKLFLLILCVRKQSGVIKVHISAQFD